MSQKIIDEKNQVISEAMQRADAVRSGAAYFMEMYLPTLIQTVRMAHHDVVRGEQTVKQASKFMNNKYFNTYSLLKGYDYRPALLQMLELAKAKKEKNSLPPDDILYWYLVQYRPNMGIEQSVYRTNSNRMYKEYQYLNMSGYYEATNQHSVRLALHKGAPIEPQWEQFQKALPLVIPLPAKVNDRLGKKVPCELEGWKPFGVFEHTLSYSGSYDLYVKDDDAVLKLTRYSRDREIFKGSVRKVFEYIYENHYYQKVDKDGKEIYESDDDDN